MAITSTTTGRFGESSSGHISMSLYNPEYGGMGATGTLAATGANVPALLSPGGFEPGQQLAAFPEQTDFFFPGAYESLGNIGVIVTVRPIDPEAPIGLSFSMNTSGFSVLAGWAFVPNRLTYMHGDGVETFEESAGLARGEWLTYVMWWGSNPLAGQQNAFAEFVEAPFESFSVESYDLPTTYAPTDMGYPAFTFLNVEVGYVSVHELVDYYDIFDEGRRIATLTGGGGEEPTGGVTLTWDPPLVDGGLPVIGYVVSVFHEGQLAQQEIVEPTVEVPAGALVHVVAVNGAGQSTPVEIQV